MDNEAREKMRSLRPVIRKIGVNNYGGAIFTPEVDTEEPTMILKHSFQTITNEVKIEDLKSFISNEKQIKEEFDSLPCQKYYKCSVARRPENIESKHRYYFSQAYDHTRAPLKVIFSDEDSNDYIAASRVDSFLIPGRFIASQAPLPETFNDFWKLIYDYDCSQIVTLNELIEDGLTKGHKYWPEEGTSKQFGSISVENYESRDENGFTLNFYKLNGHKGTLTVEHYFYKEWPDHGVPNDPKSFLNLITAVKQSQSHESVKPVLVHCSAGAGRSCTFILIYNMIEMGEKHGKIDVYKYFLQLRTQRAYAVETLIQYNFVYKCLLDYFS